jgi:hypothetical protein
MEIISHRGNLDGPDPTRENTIEAITGAMALGYSVEFDVRYCDGTFYFGHDRSQMPIDLAALSELVQVYDGTLYAHCKTVETLQWFTKCPDLQEEFSWCDIIPFFHDIDECILLKNDLIWVHPRATENAILIKNAIFVQPTLIDSGVVQDKIYGVCTDYPNKVKANLK